MRAAILSALMSFTPVAPVDLLRFLNVPAIVLTLRERKGRACHDGRCRHPGVRWRKPPLPQ
ncbi:MAG: hypothetical protein ACTHQM_07285 [Thermoanaerobaculia bacterium]